MEVIAVFQDHQSRCAIRVDVTTSHTYFIENTGSEYEVSKLRTEAFLKRFHLLDGYDPRRAASIYLHNTSLSPNSAARTQLIAITENTMSDAKTFRAPVSSNPFTKTMDEKVKEATTPRNAKKEVAVVQKKQEEAAKKLAPKIPLTPEKAGKKKAAPVAKVEPKKEAAPKVAPKKVEPKAEPKKAAPAAPKKVEPKAEAKKAAPVAKRETEDPSAITVRLAKNPPAGVGISKRDKIIVEILQTNGKSMQLDKLLKAMGKQIEASNGRTMESVWRHHGAPSQVLRSEGIITVK